MSVQSAQLQQLVVRRPGERVPTGFGLHGSLPLIALTTHVLAVAETVRSATLSTQVLTAAAMKTQESKERRMRIRQTCVKHLMMKHKWRSKSTRPLLHAA